MFKLTVESNHCGLAVGFDEFARTDGIKDHLGEKSPEHRGRRMNFRLEVFDIAKARPWILDHRHGGKHF